jgi:hypothetical protein
MGSLSAKNVSKTFSLLGTFKRYNSGSGRITFFPRKDKKDVERGKGVIITFWSLIAGGKKL